MILRQQPRRWVHTPQPVKFRPGKDNQRRPGKKTLLRVCVLPKHRLKRPMSLRSHGSGEEGLWHAIRSFEHQSSQLSVGGDLLHAGAILGPRIMGRHVSRSLQLLDAVIASL